MISNWPATGRAWSSARATSSSFTPVSRPGIWANRLGERFRLSRAPTTPGIAPGEEMCRYLWDAHVAAVASDTFAVEAMPPDRSRPPGSCTAC